MEFYKSFLRKSLFIILVIGLLPIGIGILIVLTQIGFAADYGNTEKSLWTLVLPVGFLLITGYILYVARDNAKKRRYNELKAQIREEIRQETDQPKL